MSHITNEHQRTKVRKALEQVLRNAPTDCAENVFADRAHPITPGMLPCILIYAQDEKANRVAPRSSLRERKMTVTVEINVSNKDETNPDDAMDRIALQVEKAIDKDPRLQGTAIDTDIDGTGIELLSNGKSAIVTGALTLVVDYHTGH
jgi:hypothetical protein